MPEPETKVAVVGFGNWGKNLVREFSAITSVPICYTSGNPKNIELLKRQFPKIVHTTNFQDILTDDTIGAVAIATPIETHVKLAEAALRAGKHVFLEKPPAQSKQQLKQLIKIANEKKLVIFFDHIFLYHPFFKKLEVLSKNKAIRVFFEWRKEGSFNEDIFWNLAYHDIYLALKLMGKPQSLNLISQFGFKSNADIINFEIEFENKSTAQIFINRVSPGEKNKRVIVFTNEQELIWQDKTLSIYNQNRQEVKVPIQSHEQPLTLICQDFLIKVSKGKNDPLNHKLALETIDIITRLKNLRPVFNLKSF